MHEQGNEQESAISGQLTDRQRRLIPFIINAPTLEQGCRDAGVTTTTYYKYLESPDFVIELKKARDNAVTDAMDTLKNAATKAVKELVVLLDSKNENIRRRAAVDVLTFVTKWRELNEVEDRLVVIEKMVLERRIYHQ